MRPADSCGEGLNLGRLRLDLLTIYEPYFVKTDRFDGRVCQDAVDDRFDTRAQLREIWISQLFAGGLADGCQRFMPHTKAVCRELTFDRGHAVTSNCAKNAKLEFDDRARMLVVGQDCVVSAQIDFC